MLNALWAGLIAASVVCAGLTGRLGELSTAMLESAGDAVELSLFLLGSMCAWLGFLRIAEESGLTRILAKALSPLIHRLFPDYRENQDIQGKICMNLSANLLGLGNAATPLGLAAMAAMAKENRGELPSRGMVLFVVMNTASLQLLPVNMAALRAASGSTAPFGVLPEIWITSLACLATGVMCCKGMERRFPPGARL